MKKELFAAALLALILTLSVVNIHEISGLCGELTDLVTAAGDAAAAGDWDSGEEYVTQAMDLWRRWEGYTHVVLRHNDIETLSDDFHELQEHILARDPGAARSAASLVSEHLRGIRDMERLTLGSIF